MRSHRHRIDRGEKAAPNADLNLHGLIVARNHSSLLSNIHPTRPSSQLCPLRLYCCRWVDGHGLSSGRKRIQEAGLSAVMKTRRLPIPIPSTRGSRCTRPPRAITKARRPCATAELSQSWPTKTPPGCRAHHHVRRSAYIPSALRSVSMYTKSSERNGTMPAAATADGDRAKCTRSPKRAISQLADPFCVRQLPPHASPLEFSSTTSC
mmetsp:Transcript_53121/g.119214  ORF Transcript_53121/g.119214 Transcript_53121/m.119214 type:complete len:208 (-) Transcript_53121:215-838(-)